MTRGDLEHLLRWEGSGGVWRVLGRSPAGEVALALESCDGQEMERLTTSDPAVAAYVGERHSSAD